MTRERIEEVLFVAGTILFALVAAGWLGWIKMTVESNRRHDLATTCVCAEGR